MAEILALGISHYPPLHGHDDRMAWILKRMLQNPKLPDTLRTPAGWPEPMRAEWGNDEGAASAARHRADLVGWLDRTRAALDAFKPDFVLIWGDDQYENFREDVVPPYCIAAYDRIQFTSPSTNIWGKDEGFDLPGHRTAAKRLASELIEEGFDAAYAYKPLHNPLGHAFANAVMYLDYHRKGFDYPVVPFAINCYGRRVLAQRGGLPVFDRTISDAELDPPAPTPRRLFDLGAATARILARSPWRVALLASSRPATSHLGSLMISKQDVFMLEAPQDKPPLYRLYMITQGSVRQPASKWRTPSCPCASDLSPLQTWLQAISCGQVIGKGQTFGERDVAMCQPRLGGGLTYAWVVSYLHVRWISRDDFQALRAQFPREFASITVWIMWHAVRHWLIDNYRATKFAEQRVKVEADLLEVGLAPSAAVGLPGSQQISAASALAPSLDVEADADVKQAMTAGSWSDWL